MINSNQVLLGAKFSNTVINKYSHTPRLPIAFDVMFCCEESRMFSLPYFLSQTLNRFVRDVGSVYNNVSKKSASAITVLEESQIHEKLSKSDIRRL